MGPPKPYLPPMADTLLTPMRFVLSGASEWNGSGEIGGDDVSSRAMSFGAIFVLVGDILTWTSRVAVALLVSAAPPKQIRHK